LALPPLKYKRTDNVANLSTNRLASAVERKTSKLKSLSSHKWSCHSALHVDVEYPLFLSDIPVAVCVELPSILPLPILHCIHYLCFALFHSEPSQADIAVENRAGRNG